MIIIIIEKFSGMGYQIKHTKFLDWCRFECYPEGGKGGRETHFPRNNLLVDLNWLVGEEGWVTCSHLVYEHP